MTHCKLHIPIAALVLSLLAACSSDDVPAVPTDGTDKSPIEFSMSGTGASVGLDSRAAASDASRAGFGASTRIVMRIGSQTSGRTDQDKYTRTTATAEPQGTKDYSTVTFDSGKMRYWDDADGRESQLSVYAVAVPDKNDEGILPEIQLGGDYTPGETWSTESSSTSSSRNSIKWTLSTNQSGKVANEDLCFSNNIQTGGKNGVYRYNFTAGSYPSFPGCNTDGTVKDGLEDGIMKFTKDGSSEVGKFDLGHLIFRHALTRITVKLIAGEGYNPATAFKVEHVKINNVTLTNDATYLNVTDGSWSNAVQNQTITNMSLLTTHDTGCDRQLVAHTIPGDLIPKDGATKRVEIVVDGNIYYLTDKMLYESFSALAPGNGVTIESNNIKLEQSKNYEINVKVSKKRIDEITATVVPWATVAGKEKEVNNAYISLNLYDSATDIKIEGSNPPKFYRLDDPSGDFIFEDDAWKHYAWYTEYVRHTDDLEWDATKSCWKSKWYFENNRASYHFRMTNADDGDIKLAPGAGDPFAGADYLNITTNSTDTWWGAPMKSGADLVYDFTNDSQDTSAPQGGYSSSLHWGIAATEDAVKMTLLHIKSQIDVVLKTSTKANGTPAEDAVTLHDGTKAATVKVVRAYRTASVELGRGMVKNTGTTGDLALNEPTTYFKTDKVETNPFWLNYVPQPLSRGSNDADYVGIEITTPDGNIYKINHLSGITASSVSSGNGQGQTTGSAITRWLPNHHYTYTFKLTKKGITATATVTKWNEVTAGNKDVTIE